VGLKEEPVVFECNGRRLVGIVHAAGSAATGVLVLVGGPQYRVGSHRQFLLLARHLAANDVPVMRFDYRGMGDSEGDIRPFEYVTADIRAAINAFFEASPSLSSVVLWGLCDAASAAAFYAYRDSRVAGLILLNPWVSTEAGEAKAYLRHYYLQRLFNKDLWKKLLAGQFQFKRSLTSLLQNVKKSHGTPGDSGQQEDALAEQEQLPLPDRMYLGLVRFQGWVNIIISGDDLTAAEFEDMVKGSKSWQKLLSAKGVAFFHLPEANHTFSKQIWRDQVAKQTYHWLIDGGAVKSVIQRKADG